MRCSLFLMVVFVMLSLSCTAKADEKKVVFGLALEGMPRTLEQVHVFEKQTGLRVSLLNLFLQWPENPEQGTFPLETAQAAAKEGITLCLTWEPMFYRDGNECMIPAAEILSGRYDAYIDGFARTLASFGKPCILRYAHEMNLARYHWGVGKQNYGPDSPNRYIKMFRYVFDKVRSAGATNALFAFCPNSEPIPRTPWNTAAAWYPGDAYVDVLGTDGYNWGTTQTVAANGWKSDWRTFEDIFTPVYKELRDVAPDKPLYVFETACAGQGGDKQEWIKQAFATARKWGLAGLVWFQVNKEVDWRYAQGR